MGGALFAGKGLPIAWSIVEIGIAGLIYLGILFGLKTFSEEDMNLAREGIRFLKPSIMQKTVKQ